MKDERITLKLWESDLELIEKALINQLVFNNYDNTRERQDREDENEAIRELLSRIR